MIQFYCIFVTIIYLFALRFYYKKVSIREFVSNPIVLSSVFFYIIHILLPYMQWKDNFWRYADSYNESIYTISLFLVGVAYLFLIFGFYVCKYGANTKIKIDIEDSFKGIKLKKITIVTLIFFVIGLYFAYKDFVIISIMGTAEFLRNRIAYVAGNNIIVLIPVWISFCCILFFVIYRMSSKFTIKYINLILFVFSLICSIIYFSTNQNRNSLFVFLVIFCIINLFMYKKNRLNLTTLFKYSALIIVFFMIFYEVGKIRDGVGDIHSSDLSVAELLNNTFGNHENLVWLMSNNQDLLYGQTYMAGITNVVPRKIWKDKPLGAGPALKNMIYPGSYVYGESGISSLTTGLYSELYMNFGLLGLIICSFLYGMLLKKIYLKLIKANSIFNVFIWLIILTFLSVFMLYGEFLGIFARCLFSMIPFFVLVNIKHKRTI